MNSHALARALFSLRLRANEWSGLVAVVTVWLLLAAGLPSRSPALFGAVLVVYGAALVRALYREVFAPARPRRHAAAHELELGLLLITAAYLLIAATGGPRSALYPLIYALASFLMIVHRRRAIALTWLAAIAALELLIAHHFAPGRITAVAGYHLTFIAFFAAGNLLVLSGLVRRLRQGHDQRLDAELSRLSREARDFRVGAAPQSIAAAPRSRELDEQRMDQGAVQTIHEQLALQVSLLRRALGLHTCAVLWRSDDPARLAIAEIASDSAELVDPRELVHAGVLGGLLRDPRPVRLKAPLGRRLPPYYRAPVAISELLALPLVEDGQLVGVLCADRIDDRDWSDADESLLAAAAQQITRAVAHERAFAAALRGRYEQEQFFRASERLGAALTLSDVYAKTFAAVAAIRSYDLAVITGYDPHSGRHRVLAVDAVDAGDAANERRGPWAELAASLEGELFDDGASLLAIALKNRHPLPAGDAPLDPDAVIFSPRVRLSRARSLLILPLMHGEAQLGAITLISAREGAYPRSARELLRVISHQVAVSLQNARMYATMEERATTDGLTGLTNHRAFQERFAGLHALAERRGGKLAVILTDIDHFKKINDTYGHPVGDAVLRRVAAIFTGRARKVDIVARYGGEEFVIILPDADGAGAEAFANKLREEIAAQTMTSDKGPFHVTISMGIAEYPQDTTARPELIERADQALYQCKHGGRNRVLRWSQLKSAPKAKP
jgi:two-component system cell cycle response regulator